MKTSILISSLTAALLVVPSLAIAQPPDAPPNRPAPGRPGAGMGQGQGQGPGQMRRGPEGRPMQRRATALADLGLTDVQKADLRKARESARRDRLRKSTDLKIARLDLRSLMQAEKVDDKAVAAKLAELQAAQGALLKLRVDTALAMKRLLTPEQQKKLAAMRGARGSQRLQQRMKMRRAPGQGRGRGQAGGGPGRDDLDLDFDLEPGLSR